MSEYEEIHKDDFIEAKSDSEKLVSQSSEQIDELKQRTEEMKKAFGDVADAFGKFASQKSTELKQKVESEDFHEKAKDTAKGLSSKLMGKAGIWSNCIMCGRKISIIDTRAECKEGLICLDCLTNIGCQNSYMWMKNLSLEEVSEEAARKQNLKAIYSRDKYEAGDIHKHDGSVNLTVEDMSDATAENQGIETRTVSFDDFMIIAGIDLRDTIRTKRIIQESKYKSCYKQTLWSADVTIEGNIEEIAEYVKDILRPIHQEEINIRKQEEHEKEIQDMISKGVSLLSTTGESFQGYRITDYLGCVSSDAAVSVNRDILSRRAGIDRMNKKLTESFSEAREIALNELYAAALRKGGNALIGVSFANSILDPQNYTITKEVAMQPYVFCVTATGTAVTVEKDE